MEILFVRYGKTAWKRMQGNVDIPLSEEELFTLKKWLIN